VATPIFSRYIFVVRNNSAEETEKNASREGAMIALTVQDEGAAAAAKWPFDKLVPL
jgi:hypothetical protein